MLYENECSVVSEVPNMNTCVWSVCYDVHKTTCACMSWHIPQYEEVEMTLHGWLSMQELDFYGDGIFKRVAV
jgi:hypothetical protein